MTRPDDLPNADAAFIERMLERWRGDPRTVDAGWRDLFASLGETPNVPRFNGAAADERTEDAIRARAAAILLRRAYRERGHLIADWDPLGLAPRELPAELDPEGFGFGDDIRRLPLPPEEHEHLPADSVGGLEENLRARYCGSLSAEFMHLDDPEPRDWLAWAMETGFGEPPAEARPLILDQLIEAETFERFMQTKLPTTKRFGMEGWTPPEIAVSFAATTSTRRER